MPKEETKKEIEETETDLEVAVEEEVVEVVAEMEEDRPNVSDVEKEAILPETVEIGAKAAEVDDANMDAEMKEAWDETTSEEIAIMVTVGIDATKVAPEAEAVIKIKKQSFFPLFVITLQKYLMFVFNIKINFLI